MPSLSAQTITAVPLAKNTKAGAIATSALPQGFPQSIDNKSAWIGSDFCGNDDYILQLNKPGVDEIKRSLAAFKDLGLDGSQVDQFNFQLPTLGDQLHSLSMDIHQGRGFGLIRGLDPKEFSTEDLTTIYMGISAHIGDQRAVQDKAGNVLVHIIADKANGAHHRHSTDPITFHTEETGGVISWLTRGAAASGGKCIIASATTVYNVLASTRPDLIRTLARSDWPFAFPKYSCRPVIFHSNGRLALNFGRAPLMGSVAHPRKAHLPGLNAQQIEALDAIEAISRAAEFQFVTQPGDIHFINNLSILHRRDGFTNDASHNRHLVRMRLQSSSLGSLAPEPLQREWDQAFGQDADRVYHIEPMPSHFFPLRMYPN